MHFREVRAVPEFPAVPLFREAPAVPEVPKLFFRMVPEVLSVRAVRVLPAVREGRERGFRESEWWEVSSEVF
jgi:hypothetical protein